MKILKLDRKDDILVVEPQSIEDLWHLTKVIEKGDLVTGRSFRLFKVQDSLKAASGEKKAVNIQIRVESVEFAEQSNKLRLTGAIVAGTPEEFCPHGEFHTLDLEPMQRVEVAKKLNSFHESVLDEAKKHSRSTHAVVVVMDDEKALFAELRNTGIRFGPEIRCHASKRDPDSFTEKKKSFLAEATALLKQKDGEDRQLVVAGPGFTKDEFKKFLSDREPNMAKKIAWEHCSNAERNGVHELLKKGILERILGAQKLQEEYAALERLKASLGRDDGLSVYGLDEVNAAVETGATAELLVLDELVRRNADARKVLEKAKQRGAKIVIFNSDDDAGSEFKAFKAAALLRYKLGY
ncbi:TPA: mRNA surveillance protein pelota [Candidatus Micrarchaeota archaeon]|nr:mRNA surveillance protein pelota [Candidatus Micrarchaeota archaeon]